MQVTQFCFASCEWAHNFFVIVYLLCAIYHQYMFIRLCNYCLSFDLQGQVYFKISIEDSILRLNSSNMCRKSPEKEESVGFSGRLPSLVLAFHVASEAKFLEDFAAGVHISSQCCDLELVL